MAGNFIKRYAKIATELRPSLSVFPVKRKIKYGSAKKSMIKTTQPKKKDKDLVDRFIDRVAGPY